MRHAPSIAMQAFLDGFADGLNLRRAAARTQYEVVGKRSGSAKIQNANIQSLLVLRRLHGQLHVRIE
jgi:hypothetical protein